MEEKRINNRSSLSPSLPPFESIIRGMDVARVYTLFFHYQRKGIFFYPRWTDFHRREISFFARDPSLMIKRKIIEGGWNFRWNPFRFLPDNIPDKRAPSRPEQEAARVKVCHAIIPRFNSWIRYLVEKQIFSFFPSFLSFCPSTRVIFDEYIRSSVFEHFENRLSTWLPFKSNGKFAPNSPVTAAAPFVRFFDCSSRVDSPSFRLVCAGGGEEEVCGVDRSISRMKDRVNENKWYFPRLFDFDFFSFSFLRSAGIFLYENKKFFFKVKAWWTCYFFFFEKK